MTRHYQNNPETIRSEDTSNNTPVKIIYLPDRKVFAQSSSDIDVAFIIQTTKSGIAIVHRRLVIKSIRHMISHPCRINKLANTDASVVKRLSTAVCPLVSLSSHITIGDHVIFRPSITAANLAHACRIIGHVRAVITHKAPSLGDQNQLSLQ
jgi:hypothetical protein